MALLADYAITPDVFDVMSYPNEEVCEARLELTRGPLLTEGLVRDIRDGEWRRFIENPTRAWHRRGKELIRKLATQGRLVQFSSALPNPPVDDQDWCAEALDSHRVREFAGGIIVTEAVEKAYFREPLVARIDRLGNARWWATRSPSVTLTRSIQDYQQQLDSILRCANSLMFIDPHINPAERRYHSIGTLMQMAGNRTPAPSIEIHRVCRVGSGAERRIEDRAYFEPPLPRQPCELPTRSWLAGQSLHLGRLPRPLPDQQSCRDLTSKRLRYYAGSQERHAMDALGQKRQRRRPTGVRFGKSTAYIARAFHDSIAHVGLYRQVCLQPEFV